ncbi:molybdenum-binding protein [Halobacteriales archaeon QS_5_70_17]|nr:MAG: molybdenum-binding protein [Halobacteriales archaeon QS_5_70_17]
MDPGFDARLREDGVTFGADDAALLRAIDETGSLNAAAADLGRSYARSHERLVDLEAAFGDLVERRRGGAGGGGSRLTGEAAALLARFDRLTSAFSGTAAVEETVLDGEVIDREGELAVVETPAGRVRALAPEDEDAGAVQVTLRADAVTLHPPDEAPPGEGTSARNRFSGTIAEVDRGTAVARVAVDVGSETLLAALLTVDSVDRLSLAAETRVVATTKATATRATPAPDL